ncbi:MBL fold metallo-hydrolase [Candidatus Bathyarchaeota archaeon]|nr:MBL fold metallo-hydrolase [Candidatus Bathyarchaeota archaeon]
MENVEKIADDLYVLKYVHYDGSFVGVTIVIGKKKIGLVDAGFEATPANSLFPFLKELGRSPNEIDLLVNTHRDRDHVEGSKVIREKTKANVAIHELDADAVEVANITLKDGQIVELGDRRFEVIHAPGHTPGNICLYQKENKLLITGDTLCGEAVNLIRMDKDIYVNSIKKLLQLDVKLLIQSHPHEPFRKVVLVDEEPKEGMRASIAYAENKA